ncbi:MAG: hypothetical protein CMJ58_28670 [Planctomycetaceae bacterium]|nr:hypothetical protein [Planctomycetaceae bacterium]
MKYVIAVLLAAITCLLSICPANAEQLDADRSADSESIEQLASSLFGKPIVGMTENELRVNLRELLLLYRAINESKEAGDQLIDELLAKLQALTESDERELSRKQLYSLVPDKVFEEQNSVAIGRHIHRVRRVQKDMLALVKGVELFEEKLNQTLDNDIGRLLTANPNAVAFCLQCIDHPMNCERSLREHALKTVTVEEKLRKANKPRQFFQAANEPAVADLEGMMTIYLHYVVEYENRRDAYLELVDQIPDDLAPAALPTMRDKLAEVRRIIGYDAR